MTDPTTILREAIARASRSAAFSGRTTADPWTVADDVLATRIPQACQTCKGEGVIYDLRCDNCGGSASLPLGMMCNNHLAKPTPCPDCPTIGTLLLYGWNVAKARVEGGQVSVGGQLWMTAPNLLAALREVMP